MNLPIDTTLIPIPSLGQNAQQYLNQLIEKLKVSKEIASENLITSQEKVKQKHDIKAQLPIFQINDLVLLRNTRVKEGLSAKLLDTWIGPYYIVEVGSNDAFKLRNCADH